MAGCTAPAPPRTSGVCQSRCTGPVKSIHSKRFCINTLQLLWFFFEGTKFPCIRQQQGPAAQAVHDSNICTTTTFMPCLLG